MSDEQIRKLFAQNAQATRQRTQILEALNTYVHHMEAWVKNLGKVQSTLELIVANERELDERISSAQSQINRLRKGSDLYPVIPEGETP